MENIFVVVVVVVLMLTGSQFTLPYEIKQTTNERELKKLTDLITIRIPKTRSPASAGIANRPLVFLGMFLIFGSNTATWSVENQLHY